MTSDADRPGVLDDPIDRLLVRALLADGRATFTALAAESVLSVSAAQARVRRLEARGVLRGYTALVDPEAAGLPLTAFVAITPLDPAAPDNAPERLAALDAVKACHSVAGDESYLLKVGWPRPAPSRCSSGTSGPPPGCAPARPSCCRPSTKRARPAWGPDRPSGRARDVTPPPAA